MNLWPTLPVQPSTPHLFVGKSGVFAVFIVYMFNPKLIVESRNLFVLINPTPNAGYLIYSLGIQN